jgi:hypothetical protein
MSQKGDIVKKLLLGAIFPIWRRERQKYEVAKLKFGKSTSKYIKLPIFNLFFLDPNDCTIGRKIVWYFKLKILRGL